MEQWLPGTGVGVGGMLDYKVVQEGLPGRWNYVCVVVGVMCF